MQSASFGAGTAAVERASWYGTDAVSLAAAVDRAGSAAAVDRAGTAAAQCGSGWFGWFGCCSVWIGLVRLLLWSGLVLEWAGTALVVFKCRRFL